MEYIKCSRAYALGHISGEVLYKSPKGKARVKLRNKESAKTKQRGTQWFVGANSSGALVNSMVAIQAKIKELESQLQEAKAALSQDAEAYDSINCGNPPYKVSSTSAAATVSFVKKITLKTTADKKGLLLRKLIQEKPVEYELCDNMNKVIGDILADSYIPQELSKYLASVEQEFGVKLAKSGCSVKHSELREHLVTNIGLSEGDATEIATEMLLVKNFEGIRKAAKKCNCSADEFIFLVKQSFDVTAHPRVTISGKNAKHNA